MPFNPITKYRENFENYPETIRLINANRTGTLAMVIGAQNNPAFATGTISNGTISSVTISGSGGRFPGGVVPIIAVHSTTSGTFNSGGQPVLGAVMKVTSVDQIISDGTISASYAPNDTISLSGGTVSGSGVAALTVTNTKLAAITISAAGGTVSSYAINDTITISGPVAVDTVSAVLTVTALTLGGTTISAAGINYQAGDTVFLAGGSFFTSASSAPNANQAELTISTTKLVQLAMPAGGATGQNYKVNDTITLAGGTSTTAAVLTVTAINAAGSVTAFTITTAGAYSVNATSWAQLSTSGIGTGASFASGVYGVGTVTITQGGTYTAVPSASTALTQAYTSGSGTGLTITATWGVGGVQITNPGIFTTNGTAFVQQSTSGNGAGATFGGAIFNINTVSISTAGTYLATPGGGGVPVAQLVTSGSGVGAAFLLSWAVASVNITSGGTGSVTAFTLGFLTGPATLTNQGLSIGGTGADTSEDTLLNYNLPSNAFRDIGDNMEIEAWGILGNDTNNKTINFYFGGTGGIKFSSGVQNGNNISWIIWASFTRVAQNQWVGYASINVGTSTVTNTAEFFEQANGAPISILLTGVNGTAQANDVVAQGLIVTSRS